MYGEQPDLMASMMYANNMAYNQRFAPQMMPMMQDMSGGMHAIGAQPMMHQPKKAVKDKNAPKRNWTAYQFYVEEVRVLSVAAADIYLCLPPPSEPPRIKRKPAGSRIWSTIQDRCRPVERACS